MTTALEGGEGSASPPRPLFTPGKDPVPIVQEAGWAPGPVRTVAENLAPTAIRSPDRPVRSQSLYRLSYRPVREDSWECTKKMTTKDGQGKWKEWNKWWICRQNEGKGSLSFTDTMIGREMKALSKSWQNFSVTQFVWHVWFFVTRLWRNLQWWKLGSLWRHTTMKRSLTMTSDGGGEFCLPQIACHAVEQSHDGCPLLCSCHFFLVSS